jgi:hypothetical protein
VGLDLTSTTLFTFKGVEVQLFSAKATVGAMTFSTVLAFAPNIVEFERGICVRRSAPVDHGDATVNGGGHHWASCDARTELGLTAGIIDPFVSTATAPIGWSTLLGVSFYRSARCSNIILGRWADGLNPRAQADTCAAPCINYPATSMLLPSLTFRKKVAEVTLSIAGLTLGLRALFANFGGASRQLRDGLGAHSQRHDGLGDHGAQRDLGRRAPRRSSASGSASPWPRLGTRAPSSPVCGPRSGG